MKRIILLNLILAVHFAYASGTGSYSRRPVEFKFIINSNVVLNHKITYDGKNRPSKILYYESGIYNSYELYAYDSAERLTEIVKYTPEDSLVESRKLLYDTAGALVRESRISPDNVLLEYGILKYQSDKLVSVQYYNPDGKQLRYCEYVYKNDRIDVIRINDIGNYTMTAHFIYDKDNLTTGQSIEHSDLNGKAESVIIYEEGTISKADYNELMR